MKSLLCHSTAVKIVSVHKWYCRDPNQEKDQSYVATPSRLEVSGVLLVNYWVRRMCETLLAVFGELLCFVEVIGVAYH